jgi:hypothetical protein
VPHDSRVEDILAPVASERIHVGLVWISVVVPQNHEPMVSRPGLGSYVQSISIHEIFVDLFVKLHRKPPKQIE